MAARKLLKADGDCELRSVRAPGKDLHQSLRDSTISAQQGPEFGFQGWAGLNTEHSWPYGRNSQGLLKTSAATMRWDLCHFYIYKTHLRVPSPANQLPGPQAFTLKRLQGSVSNRDNRGVNGIVRKRHWTGVIILIALCILQLDTSYCGVVRKQPVIVGSAFSAHFAHSREKQLSRVTKCLVEILYGNPHPQKNLLVLRT
jgi:hypothetical protein